MAKTIVPNLADRLRASQEARRALLERAKAVADNPEVEERRQRLARAVASLEPVLPPAVAPDAGSKADTSRKGRRA